MYRGPNRNAFNIKIIQDYQYRIIFVILLYIPTTLQTWDPTSKL